ncbi:HNH endonuclease [Streptomyces sp. WMMC897]|uniref:HNH endonuclease n=1 Tax=Streptomyces sp. WMMC897 TaxID=3014782 RepID=UPI0022B69827|nr:HNH endonuclease [Streptomyces sp. WMMC897]MCZ7413118.1 HNH endonuclease [Streptomyces sp. WMMC897]MCZ7415498.1 HNH endonuclease [Streptomyces sp. WMMC897]
MAVSKRLRYEILRRDNHACRYCGATAPSVPLRVDHVVPVALGGEDHPNNLVTSCEPCNNGKSSTIAGGVEQAYEGTARPQLTAALADEIARLWADAYQVHHPGPLPLALVNEVRQATREFYKFGATASQLKQSAVHCGLIGETYIGMAGNESADLLAATGEAFRIWRSAWRRSLNCTGWPDMDAVLMFEHSVEMAVDAGVDRLTVLRAASKAGWRTTPFLEDCDSKIAGLVGDL